jgi:hypothetical protein
LERAGKGEEILAEARKRNKEIYQFEKCWSRRLQQWPDQEAMN